MPCAWNRQFGLAFPLFKTKFRLDEDENGSSRQYPAWLDDNWYRRLALPSTEPERDRITSLPFMIEDQ